MRLRWRILLAATLLIVVPLVLLAGFTRRETGRRLRDQYTRRIETLMTILAEDLHRDGQQIGDRLAALRGEIAADNRLRLALVEGREQERPYLLDYAGRAMRLMGLDVLQLQDTEGRIRSSGHFRQEYGRLDPGLPRLLARQPQGTALAQLRGPEGPLLALARVDSFRLGGRAFSVVGGTAVDPAFLARLTRGREVAVSVVYPGGALSSDPAFRDVLERFGRERIDRPDVRLGLAGQMVRAEPWPLISTLHDPDGRLRTADLLVSHPIAGLRAALRGLDGWLLAALAVAVAGSLLLALWVSARLSRPLDQLARQAAALDLDRLEADFPSDRRDEVGALSRLMEQMTARLRASVARLREAERLAATGDLARQVNHDLRNGLTPLRNVVRHLAEVAERDPARLPAVFAERRATLESGLLYLEQLAAGWARLSRPPRRVRCSLREVVAAAVEPEPTGGPVELRLDLDPATPTVMADPLAVRRILENLVANARDSLPDGRGRITVRTAPAPGGGAVLSVADTGRGIAPEDRDRIFDDFYSTKPEGGGLGLSIVRRLVSDHEGRLEVAGAPGEGTTVTVSLPAAPAAPIAPTAPPTAAPASEPTAPPAGSPPAPPPEEAAP